MAPGGGFNLPPTPPDSSDSDITLNNETVNPWYQRIGARKKEAVKGGGRKKEAVKGGGRKTKEKLKSTKMGGSISKYFKPAPAQKEQGGPPHRCTYEQGPATPRNHALEQRARETEALNSSNELQDAELPAEQEETQIAEEERVRTQAPGRSAMEQGDNKAQKRASSEVDQAAQKKRRTDSPSKLVGQRKSEASEDDNSNNSSDSASDEEDEIYEVETIEDYWVEADGKELYLIKWLGWPESENTWEEKHNLDGCHEALTTFFFKRVDEIRICKESNANNPRQLASTLKKLPCPQDPRPLKQRIKHFFQTVLGAMPSEEELNEAFKPGRKSVKWPDAKLDKFLLEATLGNIKEENKDALKQYALPLLASYRHEKMETLLKRWEADLNGITRGMPEISVCNDVNLSGPPADFEYTNDYVAGNGVQIPNDPLMGCSCESACLANKKNCCPIYNEGTFAYNVYKRVQVKPGTPIYECNSRCKCDATCANRVVQDGTVPLKGSHLCIYMTPNNKGWGVKTMKPIKRGTFVALYAGEIITTTEADERGQEYDRDGLTYLFDLDLNETEEEECKYVVDAKKIGNISHFINHSCDPNLVVYNVFVDCIDVNLPKLALFARRDIAKNEELTFDYLNKEKDDKEKGSHKPEYPCLCGAANCRKFLF